MDILSKISKYTAPTEESFVDNLNRINQELSILERSAGAIPDNPTRNQVLQSITLMQQQMIEIMDTIG